MVNFILWLTDLLHKERPAGRESPAVSVALTMGFLYCLSPAHGDTPAGVTYAMDVISFVS